MRLRGKVAQATAVAACVVLSCTAVSGCGSNRAEPSGVLVGTTSNFPDYLDPALSLSIEGLSAMWNSYLPLLTYRHASGRPGTELIPGLARALPKVSDDGRTYELQLRPGLRYSDGQPILASDFRHSVERLFSLNSGGSPMFDDIVGAPDFERTKHGGIPGIQADDKTGKIVIHLREPSGTFRYALATLYGAPLPADTPDEDLSAHPPPASGPYEIVSSHPGRGWEYRRNPEWDKVDGRLMAQLPGGHFDRIVMHVMANVETQVNEVEDGTADWMVNPPPGDRIAELRRRFGSRLLVSPQIDFFYFWMNTTQPPFDDPRIRRAVNYAIDPKALRRIYGALMMPMQQILPVAMPGHKTIHPYPHDFRRAKELVAAAAPADRHVDVWTDSYPPNLQAAEYYEGVLRGLGLDPTLKVLSPANYFTVIGNGSVEGLDTGLGNWLLEYPHPNSYFEPQLTKAGIRATNATNWSRFEDPRLEAEVTRLRRLPLGSREEAAYARLDRRFMREAPLAPFGQLAFATFVSQQIDPGKVVVNPVFGQDLTSFARR